MRGISQPPKKQVTVIGIIRDYVGVWMRQEQFSRETVAQLIVDTHIKRGAQMVIKHKFDSHERDLCTRLKIYADAIFRWLNDFEKDTTLLPVNFIPSILDAMPHDLKLHCWEEISNLFGLGAHCLHESKEEFKPHTHLKSLIKESGEAESAIADVIADPSLPNLERAHKETTEAHEAAKAAKEAIEAKIAHARGVVH